MELYNTFQNEEDKNIIYDDLYATTSTAIVEKYINKNISKSYIVETSLDKTGKVYDSSYNQIGIMRRHISYNAASIFARANIIVPNLIFKFTNEEVMNVKSTYGERDIYRFTINDFINYFNIVPIVFICHSESSASKVVKIRNTNNFYVTITDLVNGKIEISFDDYYYSKVNYAGNATQHYTYNIIFTRVLKYESNISTYSIGENITPAENTLIFRYKSADTECLPCYDFRNTGVFIYEKLTLNDDIRNITKIANNSQIIRIDEISSTLSMRNSFAYLDIIGEFTSNSQTVNIASYLLPYNSNTYDKYIDHGNIFTESVIVGPQLLNTLTYGNIYKNVRYVWHYYVDMMESSEYRSVNKLLYDVGINATKHVDIPTNDDITGYTPDYINLLKGESLYNTKTKLLKSSIYNSNGKYYYKVDNSKCMYFHKGKLINGKDGFIDLTGIMTTNNYINSNTYVNITEPIYDIPLYNKHKRNICRTRLEPISMYISVSGAVRYTKTGPYQIFISTDLGFIRKEDFDPDTNSMVNEFEYYLDSEGNYISTINYHNNSARYILRYSDYLNDDNGDYIKTDYGYFKIVDTYDLIDNDYILNNINGSYYKIYTDKYEIPVNRGFDPYNILIVYEISGKSNMTKYIPSNTGTYKYIDSEYSVIDEPYSGTRYKKLNLSSIKLSDIGDIDITEIKYNEFQSKYIVTISEGMINSNGYVSDEDIDTIDGGDIADGLADEYDIYQTGVTSTYDVHNVFMYYTDSPVHEVLSGDGIYLISNKAMLNKDNLIAFVDGVATNDITFDNYYESKIFGDQVPMTINVPMNQNSNVQLYSLNDVFPVQDIYGVSIDSNNGAIDIYDNIQYEYLNKFKQFPEIYLPAVDEDNMLIFLNGYFIDKSHFRKISQNRIVFNNLGDFGMNWNSNFRYEIDELKIYFNKNILYKKLSSTHKFFYDAEPDVLYRSIDENESVHDNISSRIYKLKDKTWDMVEPLYLSGYNGIGIIISNLMLNYKSKHIESDLKLRAFSKYILPIINDINDDLSEEIREYFSSAYDKDGRIKLELLRDDTSRDIEF